MPDLLLEIGCEELPASFVEAAIAALPGIAQGKLQELRLSHANVRAVGTPRRLALLVDGLADKQPDLDEEVLGPPVRAAFKDGKPTRAAEAFAEKLGVSVDALRRTDTPKGEYLVGKRQEAGRATSELLPPLLDAVVRAIPFRKSMRWADLDFTFGRPIQWLVALFGNDIVELTIAGVKAGRTSLGHRFLPKTGGDPKATPNRIEITAPAAYAAAMSDAHVVIDPADRRTRLDAALREAAKRANGVLIEDDFLMGENLSLVEEPFVIVGDFEESFLELPERVILEVAKGHQRYFGIRDANGKLLPKYLAVVNTALEPELIKKGNDRVMRARLADAQFFYREDVKAPLVGKRDKLAQVVFQKRLGSVLEKVTRIETLTRKAGALLSLPADVIDTAVRGAELSKCDLVSYMVGEFPELQGEMGAAYAKVQGTPAAVADVIRDHYKPKGASDEVAPNEASALVAIADRTDSLVGCFAIGLSPTGAADPFALRRATLGILRTLLDRNLDLSLRDLYAAAFAGYANVKLDLDEEALLTKLAEFSSERLRGLLEQSFPADVVRAAIGASSDRPVDVKARAQAIAALDQETRSKVGEVFKRAQNIAKQAPEGEPSAPPKDAHASELALFEAWIRFRTRADENLDAKDHAGLLREVAAIAPTMAKYFEDVLVMSDDVAVRDNRLKLMRSIAARCSRIARLELLAPATS